MNFYGNYLYRHILLLHGADYVFSELIRVDDFDNAVRNNKFDIFEKDLNKTIFQIGASSEMEIGNGINILKTKFDQVHEINLNMGCPHSSMKERKICGGILYDEKKIQKLSEYMAKLCRKEDTLASVKLRLGTSITNIRIKDYIRILEKSGIEKVYIHARPLCYPYDKPAIYDTLESIDTGMEIVLNGDIDSYDKYKNISEKYKSDGIMIGRAALSNPMIFDQIKTMTKQKVDAFEPIKNDPNLKTQDGMTIMSKDKKKVIIDFLDIAQEKDARKELVIMNLNLLLKGITGASKLLKRINQIKDIEKIRKEVENI